MTHPDPVFGVNTQLVACEVVDAEAVIINLSNGMYYTMDEVGADVWQLIEQGASLSQMATALAGRHAVDEAQALADVTSLIEELRTEELVVQLTDATPPADVQFAETCTATYSKPSLVRYNDMSEVLALDPPLPELDPSAGATSAKPQDS